MRSDMKRSTVNANISEANEDLAAARATAPGGTCMAIAVVIEDGSGGWVSTTVPYKYRLCR